MKHTWKIKSLTYSLCNWIEPTYVPGHHGTTTTGKWNAGYSPSPPNSVEKLWQNLQGRTKTNSTFHPNNSKGCMAEGLRRGTFRRVKKKDIIKPWIKVGLTVVDNRMNLAASVIKSSLVWLCRSQSNLTWFFSLNGSFQPISNTSTAGTEPSTPPLPQDNGIPL